MKSGAVVTRVGVRGCVLAAGLPLLLGAGESPARPAAGLPTSAVMVPFDVPGSAAPVHDLHVAYADIAVAGGVLAGRLRFFKDDLERAVGAYLEVDAVALTPGPEADALVLRYLQDRLNLAIPGGELSPKILRSGEDLLDREPVWWVVVHYESEGPVDEITVRNTLLMELFDDQRNVMKFVHFPEGTPRTFYFARGEEERRVRFD
ncbi:MAG TPA: DUF6702 family protein [Longimicrobiales bacterium]|nr:DUF6702 family protein [Longimicrobiales bacterium]